MCFFFLYAELVRTALYWLFLRLLSVHDPLAPEVLGLPTFVVTATMMSFSPPPTLPSSSRIWGSRCVVSAVRAGGSGGGVGVGGGGSSGSGGSGGSGANSGTGRQGGRESRVTGVGQQRSANRSLANLHELTERIADLLQVGSIEKSNLHCPKDAPLGYLEATTHVVVVFGKHLIRDQISVEYAKRVVTLVKQIASGALNPDIICFTGGKGVDGKGNVSEAVVGYGFFRNVCEEAQIDVSRFDFILEEKSRNTKENIANVIGELRRRSGSHAVSTCHFTFVSSDYHLIRIQEVHRLSPRQSVLFPLEVSSATWNCIFAAYPFCVSRDPATAFLGRAVVLANDLGILLVNLNGAMDDRQFVARENLHRLSETFAKMREMYRVIDSRTSAMGGFRTDMRVHAETLELAIHDIREVQTLLGPLNETGASIPRAHLHLAREFLSQTIARMRSSMDPDRVLRVNDRVAIMDDMLSFVTQERLKPRKTGSRKASDGSDDEEGLRLGDLVSGEEEALDLGFESSDDGWSKGKISSRRRTSMSSEVTWRGGPFFKGNGKKITRDGPNIVIMDSGSPTLLPSSPPAINRSRRRTVSQSDSLAGRLATAFATEQRTNGSNGSSRSTTGGGSPQTRNESTAPRKTKSAAATTSTKKRKSSARKLASPSAGETA